MSYMQTDGIKIDKNFPKNLGQYFMDGFGSDGTVGKGLNETKLHTLAVWLVVDQ